MHNITTIITLLQLFFNFHCGRKLKKNGLPEPRLFPASDTITGTSAKTLFPSPTNHCRKMTKQAFCWSKFIQVQGGTQI